MYEYVYSPAYGDREERRLKFRVALFKRRGIDERHAFDLADRLFERDAEKDDRRFCLECRNFRTWIGQQGRDWRCEKKDALLLNQLQRCGNFEWEKPNQ